MVLREGSGCEGSRGGVQQDDTNQSEEIRRVTLKRRLGEWIRVIQAEDIIPGRKNDL